MVSIGDCQIASWLSVDQEERMVLCLQGLLCTMCGQLPQARQHLLVEGDWHLLSKDMPVKKVVRCQGC